MRAQRKFADQRAACGDLLGERLVARRINPVDAMAEKGNRIAPGGQCAAMRRRINSLGQPADDRKADARQMLRELEGIALSAASRIAAANDRDRGQPEQVRVAVYI
jgi:endonuclease V-like protein UPF0215 family